MSVPRAIDLDDLARHGFALARPDPPIDVDRWRTLALERCGATGSGFYTDLEQRTPEERAANEQALAPLWADVIPAVLPGHRPFMSSFLVKWPGPDSGLYVHQDSTYVDESVGASFAFWVALDDADDDIGNGPLRVLPGSHLLADEYRGTLVQPWYSECREAVFEAFEFAADR